MKKLTAVAAFAALCAVAAILLTEEERGESSDSDSPAPGASGDLLGALRSTLPIPEIELAPEPEPEVRGPRFSIARVQVGEEIELRASPGGEVIAKLADETEFGSQRNFWVQRTHGDWFGVPAAELGNGELGWIRDDGDDLELYETSYFVVAHISRRSLELRYGNQVLERIPVTVGAPGSPTPTGSYSITDGLAGKGVGPYYGCCILALSGHQPNLPPDWLGGDRIAIHGTPGALGGALSAGCLRASDMDMVSLFARVPLGAPVFIRP
jgi:L,D-transpeptidase catalytic domain